MTDEGHPGRVSMLHRIREGGHVVEDVVELGWLGDIRDLNLKKIWRS
jgi:hypothetical protein